MMTLTINDAEMWLNGKPAVLKTSCESWSRETRGILGQRRVQQIGTRLYLWFVSQGKEREFPWRITSRDDFKVLPA